jgi:ATP-binding cassette, subfamily B, bacterial CvaB/MchF/RaxB
LEYESLCGASASKRQRINIETLLKGGIELRNISYRYAPSDPLILDSMNLSVKPSEHIAITGPSGGGKSTLIKLLLGLVELDTGEILIDGLPLQFMMISWPCQCNMKL